MSLAVALSKKRVSWVPSIATVLLVLTVGVTTMPTLGTKQERSLSPGQVVENIKSMLFLSSSREALASTAEWRMRWWSDIVQYTLNGPYLWTGRGFGINLATEDGYQTDLVGESLRSPHNVHMTILARMGVPGVLAWITLLVALLWYLFRACRASFLPIPERSLAGWALCYLVAFIVNASFDVFLEGPQGGIWFWSMVGIATAVVRAYQQAEKGKTNTCTHLRRAAHLSFETSSVRPSLT
jgi:O-antigen ligase